ncbi:GTPase [Candidatus Pacearchaeota archaeon CG_4_9_14_0_2_um_filter_39_13]|nr:GTPase [Candidatus Pacearchaeota archaeon]PJC45099.1 MAG: GTPase [Candidatus Pacearchaeota archaeon CG_4_9_14_0_2_um_filter_39_13]
MRKRNVCIVGAGGRDFHNFLTKYRDNPYYDVKFFTAAQIPGIEKRTFPREIAGKLYKRDIPIFPEEELPALIKKYEINDVVFSYSDVSHEDVMHKASIAIACGANFVLLGAKDTMIKSKKPVISICAVRTGAGKSQTSRKVAKVLKEHGERVVAIRHPMPYGNLKEEIVQRFADYIDLEKNKCTIEEREEYEPWIERGIIIYAGVDYEKILREAEKEADVIIWDGGNNDLPFYKPDLHIVVADPHRAGHELLYHPGEANFRMADVIVINKMDSAPKEGVEKVLGNIKKFNPRAIVIKADSKIITEGDVYLHGKKVLVVEDGPTLTHGGMKYGAGIVAAKRAGAKVVSPVKSAVGSIKKTYDKYKHVHDVLPAMGYGEKQIKELETTINKVNADVVIDATPVKLAKLIKINKPVVSVDYVLKELGLTLEKVLKKKRFI